MLGAPLSGKGLKERGMSLSAMDTATLSLTPAATGSASTAASMRERGQSLGAWEMMQNSGANNGNGTSGTSGSGSVSEMQSKSPIAGASANTSYASVRAERDSADDVSIKSSKSVKANLLGTFLKKK
jgi:hypothetical protein